MEEILENSEKSRELGILKISDGKWFLYSTTVGSPREVWKQPLNGGKSVKILNSASIVVKVSPTNPSQVIAGYYDPNEDKDPWKCVLFSHNEKGTKKDLGFVRIQPTFDWNSDGKGIYFPKVNSLWYLSLSDDRLHEVAVLKDLRIINLSVSPNGKTLAITGENRASNILRITGFNRKTPKSTTLAMRTHFEVAQ